ncbi:lysM domain-containing protein [Ditylenchus destructor]|uniref:LysM domain-containing protein n=1 Tax=Ditylenchus destructor TaxID=166010 RepID=A0AAD4N6U4_9BILA|nr:lysM domain-containing protein [Ditylenchus destructor]
MGLVSMGMMNYEVRASDTLEGIAAAHDCTVGQLVKLNKMHSRMVFSGQKILVPVPIPEPPSTYSTAEIGAKTSTITTNLPQITPRTAIPAPSHNNISTTATVSAPSTNNSSKFIAQSVTQKGWDSLNFEC